MGFPVPHFDLPFRYSNGVPAVNEQDSIADVQVCIEAICRTEPGTFIDDPNFGMPDVTFTQEPINTKAIVGPLSQWEPRATLLVEVNPSAVDAAIANANIGVGVTN